MRIAYLTTSFVPSVAANSVQVTKMAHALAENGHDVTLYAAHGEPGVDPFEFYGVSRAFRLCRATRPPAGRLGAAGYLARQTLRLWRSHRADLYYGRAARLLLSAAPRGRPLRYEAHVLPGEGPRRAAQQGLFALPNFERLVCISEALADDYRAAFPRLDPSRIVVAHDGADPMDLSDPLPDAEWPGRPGAVQVGYVGGIYRGRGVETLVAAAAHLPELDFQIVGGAPDTVAMWRDEGVPDNVFFHGHVPHAKLRRIYPRLDVLTAPYVGDRVSVHGGGGDIRRWMSPLKVFEYLSTGKPILCSNVPVLREVLRDGDNALLLPGDDLGAWVDGLRRLADDPELRATLGASAGRDFETHHTWRRRAETILA